MSIFGKVAPLILGLSLVGGVSAYSANAMSITLDDTAPNSGSVTLDDNDDVVSASSPILYNLAKNAESNATGTSKYQLKTAYHWRNSDWVFYSDHHNYINGYKQGHSNYLHHKVRHGSFATVGGNVTVGDMQVLKNGVMQMVQVREHLLRNLMRHTSKNEISLV